MMTQEGRDTSGKGGLVPTKHPMMTQEGRDTSGKGGLVPSKHPVHRGSLTSSTWLACCKHV